MDIVDNIMTSDVHSCNISDNVFVVSEKMKELDVGSIPIVENNKLVGLVTDRDIVLRGIAEKLPPSTNINEVMTNRVVSVTRETSIEEAAQLMAKHKIRRLPVTDNDYLIGIVSLGDFAINKMTDSKAKQALSEISTQH